MPTKPTIIELDMDKLEDILRRVEAKELAEDDYATIRAVVESYVGLTDAVGDKNTTHRPAAEDALWRQDREDRGGGRQHEDSQTSADGGGDRFDRRDRRSQRRNCSLPRQRTEENAAETPAQGHGRNGADAYTGAEKIEVRHESLQPGDPCPQCEEGTVYETNRPGVLVRLVGQPPVGAKVYYLQKLRCNLCGVVFTAEPPEGRGRGEVRRDGRQHDRPVEVRKRDAFQPREKLQGNLGIPLPASTQWDIVAAQAERAEPVFEELVRQAAQGDVVHNDDTGVKILEMMGERARQAALADETAEDSADEEAAAEARTRHVHHGHHLDPGRAQDCACSSADASTPGRI